MRSATATITASALAMLICVGLSAATPSLTSAPQVASAAATGDLSTGRVVVALAGSSDRKAFDKTLKRVGGVVVRRFDGGRVLVIDPRKNVSADRAVQLFADDAGVRFAEPEQRVTAAFVPDDPGYADQWGAARIGAPLAWEVERGKPAVVVALVDSGVDATHPDLAGRIDAAGSFDFVESDSTPQDPLGHGTHVAGTVAATIDNGSGTAGIAGGCSIMPLRVLDESGSGSDATVAQAIRWAADRGADVINLALGAPQPSQVMQEACDYAIARDCVVVAASGNGAAAPGWVPGVIQSPASHPPVVAVGATDESDERASFSEWGAALDFVAPGVDILSLAPVAQGSAGWMSGTSMATAHVSGVAALLRSEHRDWTAEQTIAQLVDTAEDLGAGGFDYQTGNGLPRADVALGAAQPPLPAASDDDIPGIALPPSPFVERLDASKDSHDVYRIALAAGDSFAANLESFGQDGFELRLFGPGATTVAVPGAALDSGNVAVGVIAEVAATYYLDVTSSGSSGEYRVDWALDPAQPSDDDSDDDSGNGVTDDSLGRTGGGTVHASSALSRWRYGSAAGGSREGAAEGEQATSRANADVKVAQGGTAARQGGAPGVGEGGTQRTLTAVTVGIGAAVVLIAGLGLWGWLARAGLLRR